MSKPFLKMPQPDFGLYSGYTHRDDVVREMRDKYEARIRELTEWRPMREAPIGVDVRLKHVTGREYVGEVMSRESHGSVSTNSWSPGRFTFAAFVGWMPTSNLILPEVSRV